MDHTYPLIHYVAAYNATYNSLIEAGNAGIYKQQFWDLLSNNFEFNVNHSKYVGINSNRGHITVLDKVVYCVYFSGDKFRIIEGCTKDLLAFHNEILKPINENLLWTLTREFEVVLNRHNDPNNDNITQVKMKVNEVTDMISEAISTAASRGENLELLKNKADTLEHKMNMFDKTAKDVKKKMCMENVRMFATMVLFVACLIVLLALLIYGVYKIITL
jgi:hypothetical protein